jgi:GT2 family glycosyltransferase
VITCTIGVFAHNEVRNVHRALQALLTQRLEHVRIAEIVVVASGCTDGTVELAQQIARANPLVTVDVEEQRRGKAAAIKRLMTRARGEVVVFVGADTLPAPDAIEHLVAPFADQKVGMTGARVVPLNIPETFAGFAVQMLWYVHHHLALRKPKLGELVACRNVVSEFPEDTATDDLALEALVTAAGYKLLYAPSAVVYNKGPENLHDFLLQRRRIFAGELRIALKYGYVASSMSLRHVLPLATDAIRSYPRFVLWTFAVMAVELWARLLGALDTVRGRTHVVWRHAASTKEVLPYSESMTLVSLRWRPDAFDGEALFGEIQNLPASEGAVCWWDRRGGELLLRLEGGRPAEEWIERRLLANRIQRPMVAPSALDCPTVSCRTVQFAPESSQQTL